MAAPIPAVVLCVGPERWSRRKQIEELRRRCLAPGFEEADSIRLDGSVEAAPILEALATSPMGSPRRLVVVDGWEELTPETAPWLESYLSRPNPKSCLVLCAERFRGREKTIPAEWQRGGERPVVVWCEGPDLGRWIPEQAGALGKRIQPRAAELLVRHRGTDPSALELALEGLALLAGPAPEITVAHVEALIPPSLRESAFDILDSAAAGQPGRAIEALHTALGQGRMTPDQFLGALGWYLRMLWEARRGGRPGSRADFFRRRVSGRPASWDERRLRQELRQILRADRRLKRGDPAPELSADELLVRLSSLATG